MSKSTLSKIAVGLTAIALALSMSACSSVAKDSAQEALPPVIAAQTELEGQTFEINDKQSLVINVDDTEGWIGEVADPNVAEFIPGGHRGAAEFNPGFAAVGEGTTTASVTSPNGETYEFTIVVR